MSMIGREYPSEMTSYKDPKTGREVLQLTTKHKNVHLYFTDNSYNLGDKEIYFTSTRPYEHQNISNLFKMDLTTGIMTQMTDEAEGVGSCTKSPDGELLVYTLNRKKIIKVNTKTGARDVIYEEKDNYQIGHPFISHDKKYVGFEINEKQEHGVGNNYVGFAETMFGIKKSYIVIVDIDGKNARRVYADTHWVGHFQFSPDDSNIAMFCHEGPWNLVQQRIWILDIAKGDAIPCYRQAQDDSIGHEFWTRDGLIFFDDRMAGHDGTITVSKTQAVACEDQVKPGQIPFVGLADRKGNILKKIEMPFYCNHYHANNDNTMLVGDAVEDLELIDISGEKPILTTLCYHGTSWDGGFTHPHPTYSWNADQILYTSDKDGLCNLYIVRP